MTNRVSDVDESARRLRETAFWKHYRNIERALSFTEEDFVNGAAIHKAIVEGVAGCERVVSEAADLILARKGRRPPREFTEKLVELVRCRMLEPALMGEVLDVHRLVYCAKSSKEWLPVYTGLVRIMEVLEACWKYLERQLALA
jgi:hypothetical protein